MLKENGLKDTTKGGTVEIVQAENPDIKTLFDQKAIDAALVPEPWGSRLVKEANASVVLDYDKLWRNGDYPTAVVIGRTDFIKQHPDVVKKFLQAHVELTEYIRTHEFESKLAINDQIKALTGKSLPDDIIDSAFKRIKVTNSPEKEAIADLIGLSLESKFIKEGPDLTKLYDLKILNTVLKDKKVKPID